MTWALRTTISANDGAERYWRNTANGTRLVLCRNGRLLRQPTRAGRWEFTTLQLSDVALDRNWRSEQTAAVSGAITRTTRAARRAG